MENKIVSLYLSLAYCAILWAACQPQPPKEDECWRLNENVSICKNNRVATARIGH